MNRIVEGEKTKIGEKVWVIEPLSKRTKFKSVIDGFK